MKEFWGIVMSLLLLLASLLAVAGLELRAQQRKLTIMTRQVERLADENFLLKQEIHRLKNENLGLQEELEAAVKKPGALGGRRSTQAPAPKDNPNFSLHVVGAQEAGSGR